MAARAPVLPPAGVAAAGGGGRSLRAGPAAASPWRPLGAPSRRGGGYKGPPAARRRLFARRGRSA